MPFGFAPAAMHCLAHPDGEVATSKAAAKYGIAMGLSSWATTSIEEVLSHGLGNPYAMQVTIMKELSISTSTIKRAASKRDRHRAVAFIQVPNGRKQMQEQRPSS